MLYCVVHQNLKAWRQARGEILPFQNNTKIGYFFSSRSHLYSLHTYKHFHCPAHMLWLTAYMLWLIHMYSTEPNPCSTWTGTWQEWVQEQELVLRWIFAVFIPMNYHSNFKNGFSWGCHEYHQASNQCGYIGRQAFKFCQSLLDGVKITY